MKKIFSLLITLVASLPLAAQQTDQVVATPARHPQMYLNCSFAYLQGLGQWNDFRLAQDRMLQPRTFELRMAFNTFFPKARVGFFCEMAMSEWFRPRYKIPLGDFPLPSGASDYYISEPSYYDDSNQTQNPGLRMSAGVFSKLAVSSKFSIDPYLGVGGNLWPALGRPFELMIKESGSNVRYRGAYSFGRYNRGQPCLNARLNFRFAVAEKLWLVLGAEYMWIFTRSDFTVTFTDYYDGHVIESLRWRGNRMNMLGVSFSIEGGFTNKK